MGIREKAITWILVFCLVLIGLLAFGPRAFEASKTVNLSNASQAPSFTSPFGTDWMGRSMLARTIAGLAISIKIGLLCAGFSGLIALFLGILGPVMGPKVDACIAWLIDLVLSVPHTLVVILISVALGGGLRGIVIGVTLTHWTSLTRVIRAQVKQVMAMEYVRMSKRFGRSLFYIAIHHVFPHVLPQLLVGIVLIFPHAVLHEASITFLGFGLPAHEPAIGVILSESMKHLTSGKWWLAFFPGLSLILLSVMVDQLGRKLEKFVSVYQ